MLTLTAPSSKSLSHRMLIGAALADGVSLLRGVLDSEDITRTRHILGAAGATITERPDGALEVRGTNGKLQGAAYNEAPLSCDVRESGTSCRLLCAVLAAGQGLFRIHGAPRMHERPLGGLAAALENLGADLRWEGRPGRPPLTITARGLEGGMNLGVDAGESSQYLSGLLLAAPLCRKGLGLRIDRAVSRPYIGLTLQTLEDFGIIFQVKDEEKNEIPDWRARLRIQAEGLCFFIPAGVYRAGEFRVEGDWSGASYLLAAGAVGAKPLRVAGLKVDSLQGDRALLDILRRMGARMEEHAEGIAVHPSSLRGIEIDMGDCPDLVPTVAALAAFAQGRTVISRCAHLRIKESDRIAAPAHNLRASGITVEEREDGLVIEGGEPAPAPLYRSFGDHRIAMSAALLGIRHGPVTLDDPKVVAKSFPQFWTLWEHILRPA